MIRSFPNSTEYYFFQVINNGPSHWGMPYSAIQLEIQSEQQDNPAVPAAVGIPSGPF